MPHPLDERTLPGLDVVRIHALASVGILSIEDLAMAEPGQLEQLKGLSPEELAALKSAATALLLPHGVIPFQGTLPSPEDLARGLQAARYIENTATLVRRARASISRVPRKHPWAHKRTRRQLKKLRRALESLQQVVLGEGLSEVRLQALFQQLASLEAAIGPLLEQPLRKDTLRALRQAAKQARLSLT